MKTLFQKALLAAGTCVLATQTAFAQPSSPGAGKTLLMIGQIYQDEYQNFIQQVGLTPVGASFYGTVYTGSFEQGSGMGFVDYVENNYPGSTVLAAMSFKDNPGAGGHGDVNAGLNAVANGQEDGDLDSFINIFNSHPNTTFLLRIGYEVNSIYVGMNASAYINAYRRIVDRIRNAGVSNVEFVYHPVRNFSDVQAFYPGSNYVDWFALSAFNNDVCLGTVSFPEWCSGQTVEPDVARSFDWARGQGLPLLIAESAAQAPANNNESSFNDYLNRLNNLVNQYDVRGLVYINSDWRNFGADPNFTDSRVQKFSGTQNYWLNNFGDGSRYIYYGGGISEPTPTPFATQSPTPTPAVTSTPVPGAQVKIEAESGATFGGSSLYDDGAASGGQGVAYISSLGAGFSVTNVPESSSIAISYASELSGQISIKVNSNDVGNVAFNTTGSWVGSYNKVSFDVSIPANATVEVFFDSGDAAMNVDYVEFVTLAGATPRPTARPTSLPTATPTPSPTVAPTATPTAVPTPTPLVTVEPTPTPTPNSSNYFFVEHKPTGWRLNSCSVNDGTPVIASTNQSNSTCSQWERVAIDNYFFIKNRESAKYIRPDSSDNGSAIVIQPNVWTGNWTQWSYDDRGDGYGHLVNRATGKYVYVSSGGGNGNVELQPSSWRGDYTRWRFRETN